MTVLRAESVTRPRPVIVWGARGHAKVLNEFLRPLGYQVVAIFDNDPEATSPLADVPVFHGSTGFDHWRETCPHQGVQSLVAIGGQRGKVRCDIQERLATFGIEPLTAIHPRAFVADGAIIGAGSQCLAHSSVGTEAVLGRACIVNTNASVDHESVLGNGVHVAPGATITGCVEIGDFSMIGAGAVVLPRIRIGRNVSIGAGAVVTRDIPDDKVAYGNPAKIIRDNVP